MHCDMQFLVVKISTLPCILNGVGIAVSRIDNIVIASIITSPYGNASNFENSTHTSGTLFRKDLVMIALL